MNTFSIYQIKNGGEKRNYIFQPLERLRAAGLSVDPDNYACVYTGELSNPEASAEETLDALYQQFNLEHPKDFTGRSVSVSDVIVLCCNEESTAYYVDDKTFAEAPEFVCTLNNERAGEK